MRTYTTQVHVRVSVFVSIHRPNTAVRIHSLELTPPVCKYFTLHAIKNVKTVHIFLIKKKFVKPSILTGWLFSL